MYNKLFSKIVRSSIWLEPDGTRIVWFMFIALMDEEGFVQFASVANVAHTARITDEAAKEAIKILESPDSNSADPDHDGKRIERVPGGWMVLNSEKYRDLVTREMVKEQTRIRVARKRAKDKGIVTECNADVTHSNVSVTQSDTDTKKKRGANGSRPPVVKNVFDFEKWIESLIADPTYARIDVRREYGKMVAWCKVRGKQSTQRRFINWLNNADATMPSPTSFKNRFNTTPQRPTREPTEDEFVAQRKIVRESMDKLSQQFKMP